MTYNATYDTDDLNPIIVDVLGSAGAQVVQWIGLIVLLGVVVFILARLKKIAGVMPR